MPIGHFQEELFPGGLRPRDSVYVPSPREVCGSGRRLGEVAETPGRIVPLTLVIKGKRGEVTQPALLSVYYV